MKGLDKYDRIYFIILILTFLGAIGEFMYIFTFGDSKTWGLPPIGMFLFPVIMILYTIYVKNLNQGKWSVM